MYRERMGRSVTGGYGPASLPYDQIVERARRERWAAGGVARVTHPAHGSVVVPHRSNLAALMNAAEVWGCDWSEITGAEVRAAPGETPVKMPIHIKYKGGPRNVR